MYEALLTRSYRQLFYDEPEDYDEIIDFLTNELRASPTNSILLNNRGLAYSESGCFEKALADLNAAVQFAPPGDNVSAINRSVLKEYLERHILNRAAIENNRDSIDGRRLIRGSTRRVPQYGFGIS